MKAFCVRTLRRVKAVTPYWINCALFNVGARGVRVLNPGFRTGRRVDENHPVDGGDGVNLVGMLDAPHGLGEVARASATALQAAGIPFDAYPLADNGVDTREPAALSRRVNLLHVNPPRTGLVVRALGARRVARKINVGVWYWEIEQPPSYWRVDAAYLSEVWTGSTFCRDALQNSVGLPVHVVPPVIAPSPDARDWRAHFGLPPDRFVILCAFDTDSVTERKNPGAAIRAAAIAARTLRAAGREAPYMIMKMKTGLNADGGRGGLALSLREAMSGLEGRVLDQTLERGEMTGLLAAADAVVSLHRAEGFGLLPAEAMALGKAAIATGWSGNMDFMDGENSWPVNYELAINRRSTPFYPTGCRWAEADVEHAAAAIVEAADADMRRRKGEAAARRIARDYSAAAAARAIQARLRELDDH